MHLNAKCHEVTLMMNLSIIDVTLHTPQNRVSDTVTHGTLNFINGALWTGSFCIHVYELINVSNHPHIVNSSFNELAILKFWNGNCVNVHVPWLFQTSKVYRR